MSPNKGETTVHGCHCLGDMVVRMRKVLAIPWSWYVCFSAFTWYCYHSFAYLDCLFCRGCNSEESTGPFPYLHIWLWERLRKLSMFTSHDYIRSHLTEFVWLSDLLLAKLITRTDSALGLVTAYIKDRQQINQESTLILVFLRASLPPSPLY